MAKKRQQYAVKIGLELIRVTGTILPSGWLEWSHKKGTVDEATGLARPMHFCVWGERKGRFPECEDAE